MRNKVIAFSILSVLVFLGYIIVQEKQKQTEQRIELPQLSLQQKLDRTVMTLSAFMVCSIAYAKSMGRTPEDFGKFVGEIFAPGWQEVKGQGVLPLLQGISKNLQADKNFQVEILSASKTSVKARMNRFGEKTIKAFAGTGVTLEDVDCAIGKAWETIANYLGLEYEQKVEGDWILLTITEKKTMRK